MKNKISAILISLLFVSPVFAAKFKSESKSSSVRAEKLVELVQGLIKNESVFGTASSVQVYSFTRKDTEQNLNTIKQLNHAYGGIFSGDEAGEELQSKSAEELTTLLFDNIANQDASSEKSYTEGRAAVVKALSVVKTNPNLKIYGTSHADEDGSWAIINILDEKNSEVILIQIGFSGT